MLRRRWIPSPNFDERPNGSRIEFLIIHYTACDFDLSLKILTDGNSENRVSSHYLIDESGEVYHLVDEEKRAWHAGVSAWKKYQGINAFSLGIELVNPGHGPHCKAYSLPQMNSLIELSKDLIQRYKIRKEFILGHADIAPYRKIDPGSFFDWKMMSDAGVGVYVSNVPRPQAVSRLNSEDILKNWTPQEKQLVSKYLSNWGYVFDKTQPEGLMPVLEAFLAHYCPEQIFQPNAKDVLAVLQRLLRLQ